MSLLLRFVAPPAAAPSFAWFVDHSVPNVQPFKKVDRAEVPAVPTPAAAEFLPNFVTQWNPQWDVPRVRPFKFIDRHEVPATPTKAPAEFLQNFVSQWQTDQWVIPRVRPFKLWDRSEQPIAPTFPPIAGPASSTPYGIMASPIMSFPVDGGRIPDGTTPPLTNFVAAWEPQSVLPRLARLVNKNIDNSEGRALNTPPQAAVATFVTQWHHQWDVRTVKYRSVLFWDRGEAPATPTPAAAEFLPNFVTQWNPQWDISRVRPFKFVDRHEVPATPTPARSEFLQNFVSQWQTDQWVIPRVRPFKLWDRSEQPVAPTFPPVAGPASPTPYGIMASPIMSFPIDGGRIPDGSAPNLTNFVAAWEPQSVLPRLARLARKNVDLSAPFISFAGLPVTYVTQWHHQHDVRRLLGPKPGEISFAWGVFTPAPASIPNFISQWDPVPPPRRLRGPRFIDPDISWAPQFILPPPIPIIPGGGKRKGRRPGGAIKEITYRRRSIYRRDDYGLPYPVSLFESLEREAPPEPVVEARAPEVVSVPPTPVAPTVPQPRIAAPELMQTMSRVQAEVEETRKDMADAMIIINQLPEDPRVEIIRRFLSKKIKR